jgi:hypothetical protein
MPYTPQQIMDAITDLYTFLETNFDVIYSQCTTPQEQNDFRNIYVASRDTYWAAISKSLVDNNSTVDKLTTNLVTTNAQIKGQLTSIQNVVSFISLLTGAVQLAASLATLAAAA